jgi:hypothetical protein
MRDLKNLSLWKIVAPWIGYPIYKMGYKQAVKYCSDFMIPREQAERFKEFLEFEKQIVPQDKEEQG